MKRHSIGLVFIFNNNIVSHLPRMVFSPYTNSTLLYQFLDDSLFNVDKGLGVPDIYNVN